MSAWIFCVECGRNFEAISDEATCSEVCLAEYERRKTSVPLSEDKKEEKPQ